MVKMKIIALAAVLILVAGLVAACGKKNAAQDIVQEVPVKMEAVKIDRVSGFSQISGMLNPWEESAVSFEAAGRILELPRKEGDQVGEGDFLGRLDATEYSLQVAQAENGLEKARVSYQKAKDDFARMEQLHAQGALSLSDYESAQNKLAMAEKDYLLAQQSYSLVGPGSPKNQLRSPISGTVIAKLASVGQVVGIGTPVYRIGRIDTLKVLLPVPDSEISTWKTGGQVTLQLYEDSREGRITRVFPAVNQGTGTISVEISVDNPKHDWFPGQVVRVKHAVATREGMFVPVEAVLNQGLEKPYVFLGVEGKAVKTAVTTGALLNNRLEILSGLNPGDQVVVKGADKIFDGSKIKQAGVAQ